MAEIINMKIEEQEKEEMDAYDFEKLKSDIIEKMIELKNLQDKYHKQTGRYYKPFI